MFKAGSESETETSSATVTSTSITATTTTSTSSASGCDADKKVEDTELGELLNSPIETTSGEVFHAEGIKENAYDSCKLISLVILQGTYGPEHVETPVFFINGELDEVVDISLLVGDQAEVSYPAEDAVQVKLKGKPTIGGNDVVITVKKEGNEFKYERSYEHLTNGQIPRPGSLDFKATAGEYLESHYAFAFGNGLGETKLFCEFSMPTDFSCVGGGTHWKDPATGSDVNSFTHRFDTGESEFSSVPDVDVEDYRPVVNANEITLTPDDGSEIVRINQTETGDKVIERGDKRFVFKIDGVEF